MKSAPHATERMASSHASPDAGGAWQTICSPSYELTDAEAEGVPVALQDDADGGADTGASARPGTRASRSPARSLWPAGADVPSDGEGARDASEELSRKATVGERRSATATEAFVARALVRRELESRL